ncbi:DMT family transporter [bacterium]|nr:DMT family transporter [bacterium]
MKIHPVLLLATLLVASLEPVLARLGYSIGVGPWHLLYCKSLFSALLVLPILLRHRPSPRVVPAALLLLLTGACQLWAVRRLSAATVVTLISTTPAFVSLINQKLGREKPAVKFWLGLGICLLGILLSLGGELGSGDFDPMGLLFVAGAILSSSLYRTQLEGFRGELNSLQVSITLFLVQGLVLGGLGAGAQSLPVQAYAISAWLAVAGVAANLTFVYAVQALGATRMSVFNLLQRPLVIVTAAWLLRESLSLVEWSGVLLVLVGVHLAQSHTGTIRK